MKVPLAWLKEYAPIRLSPEALAERLTMAGLEVTAIERIDGEPVLNLEITPNRPDCLSIIGIAREVAAITGAKLKPPRLAQGSRLKARNGQPRASSLQPPATLSIRIEDHKGCLRYIGRLIEGVAIRPSPAWMQKRLVACGLRPINNVVDITNYVLLETGQPLHAFDYDRLLAGTIVVRRANAHEAITTIDGQRRPLSTEMLVVADAKRPVAAAGVMGGRETEVVEGTSRILLESAQFHSIIVRRTARALGLSSESSYRFERGVDPAGVELASRRALALLVQLAGGRQTAISDVGKKASRPVVVSLESEKLSRWLGVSIQPVKTRQALQALGFRVNQRAGQWRIRVPSFRLDVRQDVDLIEEIARLQRYDRLPATTPHAALGLPALKPARQAGISRDQDSQSYRFTQGLCELCASLGLWEVMTWSLISEEELERVGLSPSPQTPLRLVNPLSRDQVALRPTLLPGMLRTIAHNLSRGASGVRIFELGNVFEARPGPRETLQLGIGIAGFWQRSWQGVQPSDLFRLKGLIEQLVGRLVHKSLVIEACPLAWAEAGQSGKVLVDGRMLGVLGEVARRICQAFECEERVWFAELVVEALKPSPRPLTRVLLPSPFPPVKRDLSFIVEQRTELATLLELIRTVGTPLVSRLELVDRYTGPQVPKTCHSLTFSLEYRDPSRTLTAVEVDQVHAKIGQALVERFGAQLR